MDNESEIEIDTKIIENDLKNQINAQEFFWFGKAATALYLAFKAIKASYAFNENAEVILPALSCATPANAAIAAGLKVRFADVSPRNAVVNLDTIQKRFNQNTVAVLLVHLYGNTADALEIHKWCQTKNILLIEDVAQAMGANLPDGKKAGYYGDISIFSFNKTKIIETGGGLLVLKNNLLKNKIELLSELLFRENQSFKTNNSSLALSYRNLHHSLVYLMRENGNDGIAEISKSFMTLRKNYDNLLFSDYTHSNETVHQWNTINFNISERIKKATVYQDNFQGSDKITIISDCKTSNLCWRFSIRLNHNLDTVMISENIRKMGFHVSNLYWAVNDFFYPQDECLEAKKISLSVMNFWVDSSVTEGYVADCAKNLIHQLKT